jgi:hypothetical protein
VARNRRRNSSDTIFTGDPRLWPQDVQDKFARVQTEERELRERLRRQYEVELAALDRISLSRALEIAAAAGKPEPWRWVKAKIREGELRAWGTIGSREDQPIDPVWLDHEKIFKDDNGNPKPPDDDCLWFERSVVATSRVSNIAVDTGRLAMLLAAVPTLLSEQRNGLVEAIEHRNRVKADKAPEKYQLFKEWRDAEKEEHGSYPPMQPDKKNGRLDVRAWATQNNVRRSVAEGWATDLWEPRRGRRPKK